MSLIQFTPFFIFFFLIFSKSPLKVVQKLAPFAIQFFLRNFKIFTIVKNYINKLHLHKFDSQKAAAVLPVKSV